MASTMLIRSEKASVVNDVLLGGAHLRLFTAGKVQEQQAVAFSLKRDILRVELGALLQKHGDLQVGGSRVRPEGVVGKAPDNAQLFKKADCLLLLRGEGGNIGKIRSEVVAHLSEQRAVPVGFIGRHQHVDAGDAIPKA